MYAAVVAVYMARWFVIIVERVFMAAMSAVGYLTMAARMLSTM
jgi:hypothetical protein